MAQMHVDGSGPGTGGPVSVVVPTYNRAGQLERVLGAYLRQSQVCEVLVVDNGSTDRTPDLLGARSAGEPRLRTMRLAVNVGQAGARNAGAAAASGDYVFYGEDDYEPAPDHVATLLDHLVRAGADIIAGRRINVLPGESDAEALLRVNCYTDPLIEHWALVGNHHVSTGGDVDAPLLDACALVCRAVFRHVTFDPGFMGNGWREESDFQLSALEAGFRLVHCPHIVGFHRPGGVGKAQGGSRGRSRLSYELWVIRNNARFLRKHWKLIRSRRTELRACPALELAVATQTTLRMVRAARKLSRLASRRLDTAIPTRSG